MQQPLVALKRVPFNKDKYVQILRSEGVDAALSALHLDIEAWDIQTFEGAEGYQPEMFTDLIEVRAYSRELWRLHLEELKPQVQPQS